MSGDRADERAREWLEMSFGPAYPGAGEYAPSIIKSLAALLREVEDRCVEDITSEEPCPKCGLGISAQCYGCRMVAQRADLLAEVRRVVEDVRRKWAGSDLWAAEVLARLEKLA